ncbi:hypothetical protein ACJ41O_013335 [Fusarium nematophilum]
MPLFEVSPNIQESEATGRKRSHDEFTGDGIKVEGAEDVKLPLPASDQPNGECALPTIVVPGSQSTPQASPGLTEAGSSTPASKSPSPHTPVKKEETVASKAALIPGSSASKTTTKQTVKRQRRTAAEKEAHDKELARQREEREEKAAIRAVEKAKADAEKAERAKEREEKRRQKDEEKKRKEEEKKRKEEEEDKKARQQRTLGSFFNVSSTPKKADGGAPKNSTRRDGSPAKAAPKASKSEYEKLFNPFFVKEHTRMARLGPQMDNDARELKSRILDECIGGQRAHELRESAFDPVSLFALLATPSQRGKLHHPVRHIMEHVYKETEKADSEGPEHADKIMREARQKLCKVPMKVIAFSQDVRPPYYGTITFKTFALGKGNMSQLARKPTGRRLPLDYDYDSEAEWQEEEGEDLDVDEEEEELDDEDDMDGFLDDSEDAGLSRRIFANTMEPDSTGICFEDGTQAPNQVAYEHRMEFMHDGLEQTWGIDPFSTQYWEPETKTKPTKTCQASETGAKMPPPPAPANAFAALGSGSSAADAPKLVKSELMDEVKKAILDNKALSKVGIIDFIFQQFRDNVSRAEVKNTIELVAEKTGKGRSKAWALKPGHEITS